MTLEAEDFPVRAMHRGSGAQSAPAGVSRHSGGHRNQRPSGPWVPDAPSPSPAREQHGCGVGRGRAAGIRARPHLRRERPARAPALTLMAVIQEAAADLVERLACPGPALRRLRHPDGTTDRRWVRLRGLRPPRGPAAYGPGRRRSGQLQPMQPVNGVDRGGHTPQTKPPRGSSPRGGSGSSSRT